MKLRSNDSLDASAFRSIFEAGRTWRRANARSWEVSRAAKATGPDLLKTVVEGSSGFASSQTHFRPSQNYADYIVEVMCDATGQLSMASNFRNC